MAADLLDERHDCGADTLQGAEYTSDGTPCVLQAKCAGDAVGGTRTSEKISKFLRDTRAGPSTTIKRLSWTPLDDIIRGNAALDALDSKLLRVQQNHAYRRIAEKCAGCATPPISDTSISPQVLGDDAGLYTPFEPSDSTPTQKIEQIYQILHSPSEPTTSNDRLPTKAPRTTNAPEHGTVNATEPSRATACKGAPDDPTKSGFICQSISFVPSKPIFIAPQQGTKSSIPTSQTKECPTLPLDAHGFPDICASTSTAGQAVGNDGAGGYSGDLDTPCANPIVHLATNDIWYDCLPIDQDILDEDPSFSCSTKFGHADAAEISAKDGFLDGGASRDTPRICIPGSLDGKASPESPASMYSIANHKTCPSSPAFSDTPTLFDISSTSPVNNDASCESMIKESVGLLSNLSERTSSKESMSGDSDSPHCVTVSGDVSMSPIQVTAPLATEIYIPVELFDNILYAAIFDFNDCDGRRRLLGACSLVSRHWARRCRGWRFSDLRITGEHGIKRLEELLTAPPMAHLEPAVNLINRLEIVQIGSDAPWFHKIASLYDKHPELVQRAPIKLRLERYSTTDNTPLRSAFFHLPLTPPNLYQYFRRLVLRDTQFARAEDFFSLIREFSNLHAVELDGVILHTPSSPNMSPPSLPESLSCFVVSSSTDPTSDQTSLFSAILLAAFGFSRVSSTTRRPRRIWEGQSIENNVRALPQPQLDASEVALLRELPHLLRFPKRTTHEPPKRDSWSFSFGRDNSKGSCKSGAAVWFYAKEISISDERCTSPFVRLEMAVLPKGRHATTSLQASSNMHITDVSFDFCVLRCGEDELQECEWGRILDIILQLKHVDRVSFNFKQPSDREHAVEKHADYLEQVLSQEQHTRLQYKFYYSLEWYGDSPSRDDTIVISTY